MNKGTLFTFTLIGHDEDNYPEVELHEDDLKIFNTLPQTLQDNLTAYARHLCKHLKVGNRVIVEANKSEDYSDVDGYIQDTTDHYAENVYGQF